ncbi:MAG: hypothetical protein U5K28_00730 [Halobacteriales archaeon]|nr:hypothetical protein [Halobacteriales archaeon]
MFRHSDQGYRKQALTACKEVDARQFQYLDEEEVHLASSALIDALRAKDDIELQTLQQGGFDQTAVEDADYSPVTQKLRERAVIVGADQRYATEKTKAWRPHKAGGDYWTPYQRAQMYELRAAPLQNPAYPRSRKRGIRPRTGTDAIRPRFGTARYE